MQQPADRHARLGTLLANGVVRVANQSPLSRVQWLCLALFVSCAVIFGLVLQPRQQEAAALSSDPLPLPVKRAAADAAASGDGAAATAADPSMSGALDKLAGEIAKINQRLDEVVASEKRTTLRLATLVAGDGQARTGRQGDETVPKQDAEATQKRTGGPGSPRQRESLTVHRRAEAAGRRLAVVRAKAVVMPRRILRERRRRLANARSFLRAPLRF